MEVEPTAPALIRVKSRISAESWQKRVAQAQRDEVPVRKILDEVAKGLSLNEAIAKVLPADRRSWALRRIPAYRTQGFEALIDTRTPREPTVSRECAHACRHRPRRGPHPPGSPGTRGPPTGHVPGLEGQSRGAEGTERSELALYGPDELWHLGPSTDPERGHLPTRNGECGCAPTKRLRCMRRTVRVPTGGSLDTGDAGGTGTLAGRWRHTRCRRRASRIRG